MPVGKMKGSKEELDKFLDFATDLKKLWNMIVTVKVIVVVGALGMVPKGLEKRLEQLESRGRTKTIQTTAQMIS